MFQGFRGLTAGIFSAVLREGRTTGGRRRGERRGRKRGGLRC